MFADFSKSTKAFKDNVKIQIDQEDYDKYLKGKTLYLSNKGYAIQNNTGIHRIIMGIVDNKDVQIDHINHDPLDNRRQNLRIVTPQQNAYNKNIYKNNGTGYTGVHFYKPTQKYMSYIKAGEKRKHLGYFEKIEDAYTAYVRASKALHGEYAPDRVKDMDVEPLEPQPKVYKSPPWARENYKKNREEKLKKQTIRNIKNTGRIPKETTIERNKITQAEINSAILEYNQNQNQDQNLQED